MDELVLARVHADYEALPEAIKARLTLTEWLWLPDEEKGERLVQRETEPDLDD